MSAPLMYMSIHHNRAKPGPLNAQPHLIQPLPDIGLACLPYLTAMYRPFARSDTSINTTATVETAPTVIGLFSIAVGVYILQNGILSFISAQNCLSTPQQDVQSLKTGKKSPIFKPTPVKPLRSAGPFIVIHSTTASTNSPVEASTSVQKASPPLGSLEQPDLAQPSLSAQQAVTSDREAISSVRTEVRSSQQTISPLPLVKIIANLTPKIPSQGEDEKKMTRSLDPTTSATNVVSNVQDHRSHGKENKQERRTAKSRKKFNRRRRKQPKPANNQVEANKPTATDLKPEHQTPDESAPKILNGCTGNLGDNAQRDLPSVEPEERRPLRKSRNRGRKNVTRRRNAVKDGASTPRTSSPLPPRDANEPVKVAETDEEKVSSKGQDRADHSAAREATAQPTKGSKNPKQHRAKKAKDKAPNQIGEQSQPHMQASANGNQVHRGLSEAQEKAVQPLSFPVERAMKPDEALDAPQTERLNSIDRHREVKKNPRFSSQDVRNDMGSHRIVKKHWKPRRGQMKR